MTRRPIIVVVVVAAVAIAVDHFEPRLFADAEATGAGIGPSCGQAYANIPDASANASTEGAITHLQAADLVAPASIATGMEVEEFVGGDGRDVRYTITDLGSLGGTSSVANGINDLGQVTGWAHIASGQPRAFLWSVSGGMVNLGSLGGRRSIGSDINNNGRVTGQSYDSAERWRAFVWDEVSGMTDLGAPAGYYQTVAFEINDAEHVVGYAYSYSWSQQHAYRWIAGEWTGLGTLGGEYGQANGVNTFGDIVGGAYTGGGAPHAFLWKAGEMTDLGTLAGYNNSSAVAISDMGQVVGWSGNTWYTDGHAYLWQSGVMADLGTLGGAKSQAIGINDAGQVVGAADTSSARQHAFLWQNGVMYDLNDLIPSGSGWELAAASDVSEAGWIVGAGWLGGFVRAFLLVPLPPAPDCNSNGIPDADDITAGTSQDCNSNGTPDECDIDAGTSTDLDTNGVPDECQQDCNANGTIDACEVDLCHDCCETGHGLGCSDPGIEACVCDEDRYCCLTAWDETCVAEVVSLGCGSCEPASPDCNANDVPDECEPDFDGDGVIDACDPDIDDDGVPNETDVCNYTPHPLPPGAILQADGTLRGDVDGDCDVDLADYLILQQDFTGPNP
ncbi:MAG: hypothetical protein V2A79_06030 [Planctomycetota bacterium]